jgi:hypothetical protein
MGNSNTTSTGAVKSKIVNTDDGDVVVRRLPLRDYAELLRAFKKLPGNLGQFIDGTDAKVFKESSTKDLIESMLPLFADAWGDLCAILAVPTDKDEEFIAELDGADAIEVLVAILELNNYKKIAAAVKKLLAMEAPAAQPEAPADPEKA